MKDFVFRTPTRIEVGPGRLNRIGHFLAEKGLRKILLLEDSRVSELGLADPLIETLERSSISYELFDGIRSEPTVKEFDELAVRFKMGIPFDGVVGLGGGSVLDLAKMLSVAEAFAGSIKPYLGRGTIGKRNKYLALIPTTSGTGSEATPNAVLNDEEDRCKKAIVGDCLIPDLAILDPQLMISLPAVVTAETGLDALTHGIECFICKKSNAMSDIFALECVKLVAGNLRRAVQDGTDQEARYYMSLASLYGGIAIANSGTGGVHALAYPLGGEYRIGHGLSNAILLSDVMDFNAEAVPDRILQIGSAMGLDRPKHGSRLQVNQVLAEIRSLVRDVGIKLIDRRFTEEMIDALARSAMSVERLLANNPKPIRFKDAKEIYRRALLGGTDTG